MKRSIYSFVFLCITLLFYCNPAEAQSKIIRKSVKKTVTPQIAPVTPPKMVTLEAEPEAPPQPPPPAYEIKKPEAPRGIFGWGLNSDLGGGYTLGRGSAFSASGKIAFGDPFNLGSRFGLAEDAFEYKTGIGLVIGNDANNLSMFSLPFLAEAVVYLKEGSLFGLDPYLGCGANLNLIGTDSTLGGMGVQLYGGVLADFGSESGKAGISIGYYSLKVGNIRALEGLTISVSQPFIL